MSVKVLVIVIIVFDPYPNSYCLLHCYYSFWSLS